MKLFLFLLANAAVVELFRQRDSRYKTNLNIGGQTFDLTLALDTNLLMVIDSISDRCLDKTRCYVSAPNKAITQNSENCWSSIQVGSTIECAFRYKSDFNYTAEGGLTLDNVLVGSTSLKDFAFGKILESSGSIGSSGVIGLGPSNLDELYDMSLLENIITDQALHAVIGICMNNDKGYIHIGGFDRHYNLSSFVICPQLYNNRYSVVLTSLKLNSQEIALNLEARLNTACEYLLLPYPVIKKMIQILAEFYKDSCQQALCEEENHVFFGHPLIRPPASYPDLVLNIHGLDIRIKGFLQKCGVDHYCSVVRCSEKFAVIGTPILEKLYVVIDMENSQIALAEMEKCRNTEELVVIYQWEQNLLVVAFKLFIVFSSLVMIVVIGW